MPKPKIVVEITNDGGSVEKYRYLDTRKPLAGEAFLTSDRDICRISNGTCFVDRPILELIPEEPKESEPPPTDQRFKTGCYYHNFADANSPYLCFSISDDLGFAYCGSLRKPNHTRRFSLKENLASDGGYEEISAESARFMLEEPRESEHPPTDNRFKTGHYYHEKSRKDSPFFCESERDMFGLAVLRSLNKTVAEADKRVRVGMELFNEAGDFKEISLDHVLLLTAEPQPVQQATAGFKNFGPNPIDTRWVKMPPDTGEPIIQHSPRYSPAPVSSQSDSEFLEFDIPPSYPERFDGRNSVGKTIIRRSEISSITIHGDNGRTAGLAESGGLCGSVCCTLEQARALFLPFRVGTGTPETEQETQPDIYGQRPI